MNYNSSVKAKKLEVLECIEELASLQSFTERALEIIKAIPKGKVMTYGQIATLAGSPRGARQVVRILHSMSDKYQLPWHRVINAKGEVGIQDEELFIEQKFRLESEGIKFNGDRKINLERYQYLPIN
jgi:methylated-DNA-protein-cysteine methyltransferase related protein